MTERDFYSYINKYLADVDYPPKATEIMTNQIINKLWKGKEVL